ncbi:MAG: S24/S26 family peptidase [Bacteroidaceae bacterium]|nr:S24/S26 family peptidase [Bacteroidaceae bacterium]
MEQPVVKALYGDILIKEAITLLQEGRRVVLAVKGGSMHPFIIGGKESVELVSPQAPLKVGDVVLAWVDGSHYVIHRIIGIEGNQISLMGDGNIRGIERCSKDEVAAIAEYVISPKGKRRYLYTKGRMRFARMWRRLLPVRRWILAIYRRTLVKLNIVI